MKLDAKLRQTLLAGIPHREPFRFVEDIQYVDPDCVVATARFPATCDFYRGHFPGHPVTPGVILLEAMAQAGLAPHALFLRGATGSAGNPLMLFTDAQVEFLSQVPPGSEVRITARKEYFRRGKLRSQVEMRLGSRVVCTGTLSGVEMGP